MLRQINRFLQVQALPSSSDFHDSSASPASPFFSSCPGEQSKAPAFTHGKERTFTNGRGPARGTRPTQRQAYVFSNNVTRYPQLKQLDALRELNWQLNHESHCWLNYREPGDFPRLRMAVEDGLVNVAEALVTARERPGNADFLSKLESGGNAEDTPLFEAARSGDLACVHAVLHSERAESLNAINSERQTPLMLAALHGQGDIVSALLTEKVGRATRHIKTLTDLSAAAHELGHQWMGERLDAKTEKTTLNRAVRSELLGAYRLARSRSHHAVARGLLEIWRGALLEALGNINWDADVMAMAIASKRHKRRLKGESLGCFLIDLNESRVLPSLRNRGIGNVQKAPDKLSTDAFTQFLQKMDKCMAFLPEGARMQAIVQFQRGKHCTALSFEKTSTGLTVFILDATGHKEAVAQLQRLLSQVVPSAFPALGTVRLVVYEPDEIRRTPGSTSLLRTIQLGKDHGPVFALDHAFHLAKFRHLNLQASQAGMASPAGLEQQSAPGTNTPGGAAPVALHPGNLNPGFACLLRNTQSIPVLHSLPDSLTWRAINRKQETLKDYALHYQKTIETTIDGARHYSDQNTAILKKRQGFINDIHHYLEELSSEALLKHIETIINPSLLSH